MTSKIIWKNGNWFDINEVCVSIQDRSLRFSDGIFETILIKNQKAILLKEHLKRLEKSSEILNYNLIIDKLLITNIINSGIRMLGINQNQYGAIRINYSRGISKNRSLKIDEIHNKFDTNNLWIEFEIINFNSSPLNVWISKKEKRNEHSQLSKCKTFSYLQSIQALIEANNKNFDDSILLNTRNEVCCGTTFNLLVIRNDEWLTPRKESGCLQGIMVEKLLNKKLVKEEYILPNFKVDDILLAINSLSCRQIIRIDDIYFNKKFDPENLIDTLFV
tara:strand:+ start:322 stop:1149 length:828 start_codon:yes stop_codon:yes gene_type:complete